MEILVFDDGITTHNTAVVNSIMLCLQAEYRQSRTHLVYYKKRLGLTEK